MTKKPPIDKRILRRIKVLPDSAYVARVKLNNEEIDCRLIDYHSKGVSIELLNVKAWKYSQAEVTDLRILYGNMLLAEFNQMQIVWVDEASNVMGLCFSNVFNGEVVSRKSRLSINEDMFPTLLLKDPMHNNNFCHFQVINISINGLRAKTSISNKHLMPGMRLKEVQLFIPGCGNLAIELEIRHINIEGNKLFVGFSIVEDTQEFREFFGKFIIFGSQIEKIDDVPNLLKEFNLSGKKISHGFKLQVVESEDQYEQVLRIRLNAYKRTGKVVNDDYTVMSDRYDKHSLILIMQSRGEVIATVRLVYTNDIHKNFPFEEYIKFPSDKLQRDKYDYYEISRLAIAPKFQGSDVVRRLFQAVAREVIANKKIAICTATNKLKPMYLALGAIDHKINWTHPLLKNEKLHLLTLVPENFVLGKNMYAQVWEQIAKLPVVFLANVGIVEKRSYLARIKHFLRLSVEQIVLKIIKKFR